MRPFSKASLNFVKETLIEFLQHLDRCDVASAGVIIVIVGGGLNRRAATIGNIARRGSGRETDSCDAESTIAV